ncbi:twin-arginine translocase subunit TatC [Sphingobacteriales bacterium UPWRP_1]|nr:twin arginine-targeting protein translocase TatC [Sphingobacteriales bacterium TSM_CSS]PSJ71681.1 twin-arginine translocase subunit TatC [Sphingobacteriales bacterium UPWRP_1]
MAPPKSKDDLTFIEHLEELRWHLIRAIVAICIISVAAFILPGVLFDTIIFGPKNDNFLTYRAFCKLSDWLHLGGSLCIKPPKFDVINLEMSGQFVAHIKISFIAGLVVAFPYLFWEIWRFVRPGLYETEVKAMRGVVFVSSVLFLIGILFGYFIITPFSVNFLVAYSVSNSVGNYIAFSSYVDTLVSIVLASGIMFELPLLVFFLSKMGLLTPEDMRQYRRHAFVIILFVAAIITPPDVFSQVLVTIPVYLLYEFSVLVSARVARQLAKEEADEARALVVSNTNNRQE